MREEPTHPVQDCEFPRGCFEDRFCVAPWVQIATSLQTEQGSTALQCQYGTQKTRSGKEWLNIIKWSSMYVD